MNTNHRPRWKNRFGWITLVVISATVLGMLVVISAMGLGRFPLPIPRAPGPAVQAHILQPRYVPLGTTYSGAGQDGTLQTTASAAGVPGVDAGSADAGTVTLGYTTGMDDTWLDVNAPNNDYGNTEDVRVDPESGSLERTVISFTLPITLPGDAVVTSAALKLFKLSGDAIDIVAHQAANAWAQAQATWNDRLTGIAWDTAGGDYIQDPNDPVVSSGEATGDCTWSVAHIVQAWIDGQPNYGFLLKHPLEDLGNNANLFASSENATLDARPMLTFSYSSTARPATTNAITATPSVVAVGSPITITMSLTSSEAVAGVVPSELMVNGGEATCTEPTPAVQDLTADGAVTFAWICTPSSAGELTFSATAANGTVSFVQATSNGVLVSPDEESPYVAPDLGSSEFDLTAAAQNEYLYAFRGDDTLAFWTHNTANSLWNNPLDPADTPTGVTVKEGGALTNDGVRYIYALRGDNTRVFLRYDTTTDTWEDAGIADLPATTAKTVMKGGALVYLQGYVYAFVGNGTLDFWRYDVAANSWSQMANALGTVGHGAGLTTDGANIYATQGDAKRGFWRYNVASNTWTALAPFAENIGDGGGLVYASGAIYVLRGDAKTTFRRYDIATNTWTTLQDAPANIDDGAAIASDGTSIYVLRGRTTVFYRYSIAANTWTALAATPAVVGWGGALTYLPTGTAETNTSAIIGDYVWLDEDSDGVQDAGEGGIVNVRVTAIWYGPDGIPGTADDITYTTWTDREGEYIFANLSAGQYQVTVDTTTLAGGLAANPTFDYDGIGTRHTAIVSLTPGQHFFVADFGYNWAATTDVHNGTGTGAIGDRVYVDADGDGRQDPGEPGLGGVTVQLWWDSDGDGIIDALGATATTDYGGSYIFNHLAARIYEVRVIAPTGYTQTGDPDQFGVTCNVCDSKTTVPIVLAPGDVYVNADFGYQPQAGYGATISGWIWLDANGDGVQGSGEQGIAGVSVALIQDLNGNGVWDSGEPIIATTFSGAHGVYEFTGVPVTDGVGTDDYLVWVNDTNNVLDSLAPTYDSDGIGTPNISAVSDLAPAGIVPQHFGYAPAAQTPTTGLIGDAIFLDSNGNGMYDMGEPGLEGVTVRLYNSTGTTLLATTYTDQNGHYYFGGLSAATYVVKVDTSTLPGSGMYLTNSVDPDGGTANQSSVTLATAAINLTQDFGYAATTPNTISGTIWKDTDADGMLDGNEGERYVGVTVVLHHAAGHVVATATTDANGDYAFIGLPDGAYTVDVTDGANVLNGTWHSTGPNPGADNNSQSDPYTVTVSGGQTNSTADFGYYLDPGAIGDLVWADVNRDGWWTEDERGIPNVKVTLTIAYPNGLSTILATYTDADGYYSFGNLLLDEDYDGVGANEPTYTVVVTMPSGLQSTYAGIPDPEGPGNGIDNNSDDPSGTAAFPSQGTADLTNDFGLVGATAVLVSDFGASRHGNRVVVQWSTASEVGTVGFDVLRLNDSTGKYAKVNSTLLPSVGEEQGGTYRLVDEGAAAGQTYTYLLQEVEARGGTLTYGPYTVAATGSSAPIKGNYEAKAHEASPEKMARSNARKAAKAQEKQAKDSRTGEVLKLVVTEPGLYYVSAAEIAGMAEISVKDAQSWIASGLEVQNRGVSVPYLAAEGKAGLYFYGEGLESLYTDENIYWIRRGSGPDMELVKGPGPKAVATPQTFVERVHLEKDVRAYPGLFDDPEADYWIWDMIYGGMAGWDTYSYTLKTPGSVAGPGTLTVHLQGGSDTVAPLDHHVVVSLNGQEVGQGHWDGLAPFDLIASGVTFNNGDNTVVVKGLRDQGIAYSVFYVDSLSASYTRAYRAVDDKLLLRGDGNAVVTVPGFTDRTIWVLDVSDGARPKRIDATTVQKTGNSYSVSFSPASPDAEYLVVTPKAASAPAAMFADVASDLASAAHGADYIVVTPLELKDAAQTLADYRQGKGLATMVVDLEDIYDEFNHGIVSPVAIRTFLTHAYNTWSPRPQYVVLAGEGTYDYKDHMGRADNLVPVWMVSTPDGLFAADNRFVDVVGDDGVPEMAIGRLPAMTAAELTGLIDKITSYEGASGDGWANKVIMLADNPDMAGDFAATSDGVAALVPPAYAVNKIYLGQVPLATAKSNLKNAISAGALWFNYIGHGGLDRLANEGLLLASDVASLSNGAKLPVATLMTCIAGQHAVPGYDSISEVLMLRTGGGAAAVWAPTGFSLNAQADVLNQALFRAVFQNGEKSLGRAVLSALREFAARGESLYHLDIYNLQGDPALEVK